MRSLFLVRPGRFGNAPSMPRRNGLFGPLQGPEALLYAAGLRTLGFAYSSVAQRERIRVLIEWSLFRIQPGEPIAALSAPILFPFVPSYPLETVAPQAFVPFIRG